MMGLEELKKNGPLIESVDWSMTPEEAVRLYLEWGNNWSRGYSMVRSKDDESLYFVLDTWETSPVIYFIKRNSEGAEELAKFALPGFLKNEDQYDIPLLKGVYAVDGKLRDWLKKELDAA